MFPAVLLTGTILPHSPWLFGIALQFGVQGKSPHAQSLLLRPTHEGKLASEKLSGLLQTCEIQHVDSVQHFAAVEEELVMSEDPEFRFHSGIPALTARS